MEGEGGSTSSFSWFCPVRSSQARVDKRLLEPSRSLLFYLPIKLLQDNTLIRHGRRGSKPVVPNRIMCAAGNKEKRSQAPALLQKKTTQDRERKATVVLSGRRKVGEVSTVLELVMRLLHRRAGAAGTTVTESQGLFPYLKASRTGNRAPLGAQLCFPRFLERVVVNLQLGEVGMPRRFHS